MREISINNYKLMLCEKFWGAGFAYIRELYAILRDPET
jgi:hypothetical protein